MSATINLKLARYKFSKYLLYTCLCQKSIKSLSFKLPSLKSRRNPSFPSKILLNQILFRSLVNVFRRFDTRKKKVLSMSNFKKLLEHFDIECDKHEIKGVFNMFGSGEKEFGVMETVNHQIKLGEFLSLFNIQMANSRINSSKFEITEREETTIFCYIKMMLKNQINLQKKINKFRCALKLSFDFVTLLKLFCFSHKNQYISRRELIEMIENDTGEVLDPEDLDHVCRDMELCQELPIIDLVLSIYDSENREELQKLSLVTGPSETMVCHEELFKYL
ncbi:unnamed protein product [Moneuplotes crassus]|uniref:EF-hand domain-containing protein n=1 Tax=Euplotes crassus TaxID=5936 RepID=A0AAD1XL83_EUPCR|nr:unnamed protein product [Moneuplotes crassus]